MDEKKRWQCQRFFVDYLDGSLWATGKGLGVDPAALKVGAVLRGHGGHSPHHHHVLAVGVRSSFAVVEGTCLDMGTITDDHLVVEYGEVSVDADFDASIDET